MRDFSAAIGLVFAIEGLLLAGFADVMRAQLAQAARTQTPRLRWIGVAVAAVGVAIVWIARAVV